MPPYNVDNDGNVSNECLKQLSCAVLRHIYIDLMIEFSCINRSLLVLITETTITCHDDIMNIQLLPLDKDVVPL